MLDDALLRLREALSIKERLFGKRALETAATLDNLGYDIHTL